MTRVEVVYMSYAPGHANGLRPGQRGWFVLVRTFGKRVVEEFVSGPLGSEREAAEVAQFHARKRRAA